MKEPRSWTIGSLVLLSAIIWVTAATLAAILLAGEAIDYVLP